MSEGASMSSLRLSLLLSTALTLTATSSLEAPAHYKFSYQVRDELSGQDFGQEEERTGSNTGGEYRVSLPDGRKQIVTYTVADTLSGYIADVSYQECNRQSRLIAIFDWMTARAAGKLYKIVVHVAPQGEAKFAGPAVVVSAPPPIRVMPSLPRAHTSPASTGSRVRSQEEERFYARPTKIVPSVIKVKKSESQLSQKPVLVPRANKPSVQPGNVKKPISAFKSVVTTKDKSNTEDAPVYVPRWAEYFYPRNVSYISSEPPTMFYKQKYKMRPSQGLNSLFREDTDTMKSDTKE